jgi:hypothetical protein
MVGLVEKVAKTHGIDKAIQMTLAITDGKRIWFFRYASPGCKPGTLSFSTDIRELRKLYPDVPRFKQVSDETRMVVSEPFVDLPGAWQDVKEGTWGVIRKAKTKCTTSRRPDPFSLRLHAGFLHHAGPLRDVLSNEVAEFLGRRTSGSAPSLNHVSRSCGSSNAFTTASRSFCTMGRGVPAGSHSPYHEVTSKDGKPDSIAVGISGTTASASPTSPRSDGCSRRE